MVSLNMREMLEAGVHFGHQVRKWNPKMKPYIYGKKNGIYIINLQTSIELFKQALEFITEVVGSGKEALIVGTKRQAQSIVTDVAEETGMHYVNKRWLGGLLTNFTMVRKSIDRLIDLDEMKKDGRWEVKSKKEQSKLEKVYKKLHKNLWGIRNLKELPGVLIVIDSNFEEIAVYEAQKLGIPIVGIVDTNANPEYISHPVPGNDDAIRSIKLFSTKFGEAVKLGLEKRLTESIIKEEELEAASTEDVGGETPEKNQIASEKETPGKEPVAENVELENVASEDVAEEEPEAATTEEAKEVAAQDDVVQEESVAEEASIEKVKGEEIKEVSADETTKIEDRKTEPQEVITDHTAERADEAAADAPVEEEAKDKESNGADVQTEVEAEQPATKKTRKKKTKES